MQARDAKRKAERELDINPDTEMVVQLPNTSGRDSKDYKKIFKRPASSKASGSGKGGKVVKGGKDFQKGKTAAHEKGSRKGKWK